MKRIIKSTKQPIFSAWASSVCVGDVVRDNELDVEYRVDKINKHQQGMMQFTSTDGEDFWYDVSDEVEIVDR